MKFTEGGAGSRRGGTRSAAIRAHSAVHFARVWPGELFGLFGRASAAFPGMSTCHYAYFTFGAGIYSRERC